MKIPIIEKGRVTGFHVIGYFNLKMEKYKR